MENSSLPLALLYQSPNVEVGRKFGPDVAVRFAQSPDWQELSEHKLEEQQLCFITYVT